MAKIESIIGIGEPLDLVFKVDKSLVQESFVLLQLSIFTEFSFQRFLVCIALNDFIVQLFIDFFELSYSFFKLLSKSDVLAAFWMGFLEGLELLLERTYLFFEHDALLVVLGSPSVPVFWVMFEIFDFCPECGWLCLLIFDDDWEWLKISL